ncbi:hypothetical protein MMC30_005873 [Trapelia coarctata]|nr:hypothetical protein [Trapelia coarctata]
MDEERSPQPMFRKPSLAHEAEAAIIDSTKLVPSASTDSLANNTSGTTFAAKARAAELQAARARKQLKENDKQNESGPSVTPHEVMTFTKPRSKAGKIWKTLNLNDLPEVQSGDSQSSMYHNSPELPAMTNSYISTKGLDSGYDHNQGLADATSGFIRSDHFTISMLESSHPQMGLSPDSQKLVDSVESYDISQWDPELPTTNATRAEISPGPVNPQTRTRASSSTIALRPLPVLTTSSDQLQKQALYLHQKQESQLSEMHAALNGHFHHNSRDADKTVDSVMALLAQDQSSEQFLVESPGVKTDEDPFAASPSPISPPSFAQQHPYNGSEIKHGLVGPAPRKFVPHQYPAVKGTTSAITRLGPQRTLAQESSGKQNYDQFPTDQDSRRCPRTKEPQTPYRKLSVAEKKGMLLQQLQTVVDESASSTGFSKSSRTVLHDPFAHKDDDSGVKTAPSVQTTPSVLASSETDLVIASDPLPWKTRPVNIVRPPSPPNDGSTATSVHESTPTENRRFRGGSYRSQRSGLSFADEALIEAERWWSTDTRVDGLSMKQITDFLGGVREGSNGKAADVLCQRGIVSENTSESLDATAAPANSQSKDVAEHLLVPVLANLQTYLTPGGYFNKHGRVPEWCIDQGINGQLSFFGEDWGAPPPRVGRDPRYQPVLHEGTRSVYENLGTRWGSEGYARRYPIR